MYMKNSKKKIDDLSLEELHNLYSVVNEICGEFSRMTDNYSLTTGDNKFENLPSDVKSMINDRQKFVSYKLKIKDALINKVNEEMSNYE